MEQQFMQCFAEALEKDVETIHPSDAFREYEEWDSLSTLSVLAMLENDFEVIIPRQEFMNLHSLHDLYTYIVAQKT